MPTDRRDEIKQQIAELQKQKVLVADYIEEIETKAAASDDYYRGAAQSSAGSGEDYSLSLKDLGCRINDIDSSLNRLNAELSKLNKSTTNAQPADAKSAAKTTTSSAVPAMARAQGTSSPSDNCAAATAIATATIIKQNPLPPDSPNGIPNHELPRGFRH